MTKKPNDTLREWIEAVNAGDVEKLLGLYDRDAVLIPTFSNRVHNTPEKLREYFERLGAREGLSVSLHEKTLKIQQVNDDIAMLSGIYNWRFVVDEELLNFEARFSYVMNRSKPNPILHHHSSQIPRTL